MAASAEPSAKTSVNTRRTLMPSACTISPSCTPARMIMPSRVRRNIRPTPMKTRMPIKMTNTR